MDTPLLAEFDNYPEVAPTDPAKKILFAVLFDLFGRSGLDHQWTGIDDEIKEELLETNLEIVRQNMPSSQD